VQLIQFTLHHGPTVQTEMSLATAGIHCTISQRLSGAMEDCSIVRGQQLGMLCHQRTQWCSAVCPRPRAGYSPKYPRTCPIRTLR